MKLEFPRQIFEKKIQILRFIKIRPVRAELFYADGRTDRRTEMTKLRVAFHSFANASKNSLAGPHSTFRPVCCVSPNQQRLLPCIALSALSLLVEKQFVACAVRTDFLL